MAKSQSQSNNSKATNLGRYQKGVDTVRDNSPHWRRNEDGERVRDSGK